MYQNDSNILLTAILNKILNISYVLPFALPFPNNTTCETDRLLYEIWLALNAGTTPGTSSGLINKTVQQTLNDGDNTVNHALGQTAIAVTVLDSNNNKIEAEWSIIDNNNINVNISGGGPVTDAIINVIADNLMLKVTPFVNDLLHGNNTINHNLNATVTAVTVLDNANNKIEVEWSITDINNININNSGNLLTDAKINIFTI